MPEGLLFTVLISRSSSGNCVNVCSCARGSLACLQGWSLGALAVGSRTLSALRAPCLPGSRVSSAQAPALELRQCFCSPAPASQVEGP